MKTRQVLNEDTSFCYKLLFEFDFFFQALQSALLKNETKNLLRRDASQLKIA